MDTDCLSDHKAGQWTLTVLVIIKQVSGHCLSDHKEGQDVTLVEFLYTLYVLTCLVIVTVGDSGLCCCVCVTSFKH